MLGVGLPKCQTPCSAGIRSVCSWGWGLAFGTHCKLTSGCWATEELRGCHTQIRLVVVEILGIHRSVGATRIGLSCWSSVSEASFSYWVVRLSQRLQTGDLKVKCSACLHHAFQVIEYCKTVFSIV